MSISSVTRAYLNLGYCLLAPAGLVLPVFQLHAWITQSLALRMMSLLLALATLRGPSRRRLILSFRRTRLVDLLHKC